MNVASKLYNWLFKLSPNNAANPDPSAMPHSSTAGRTPDNTSCPIDTFLDQETILGSDVSLGFQHKAVRTANGELVRLRTKTSFLCGCGHLVSQFHAEIEPGKSPQRGIEGKCFHCQRDLSKLVEKRLISQEEADRQAFVCTECARMVAGVLCCPKHYIPISDGNGRTTYISLDEHTDLARKEIARKILTSFGISFNGTNQAQLPGEQE